MDRRRFLRAAAFGGAALALTRPALAAALDDPVARFAQGLARHPWLAGWQDAPLFDATPRRLDVVGRVPDGLRGSLYRNGPGRFSRAGFRYQHWFDGDGLLQAWQIGADGISHRARFVGTRKFQREEAAGRFLLPAAGTRVPGAVAIRNSDDLNVANTAVLQHAGALYALWEGGSAYAIDADTLLARGPKTWREDLGSVPFSAHPLHERDGSLWNFGLLDRTLVIWQLDGAGAVRRVQPVELPFAGYLHAFSMTERYLVFVLLPYVRDGALDGRAYFEAMRWQPERGCRALVVDKADLERRRWYGLPAGAAYHYGLAYQHGRELVLHACWNRDGAATISPFRAELQGRPQRVDSGASLERITLHLDQGHARMDTLIRGAIDFPAWDEGTSTTRMFALSGAERSESGYFDAISAIDGERGQVDRYVFGPGCMVEEHRFVPAAGRERPQQGWLVGCVLDYRRGRSGISIFDAEQLGAGPLAQAWLPHSLPLGFHGWFQPSA